MRAQIRQLLVQNLEKEGGIPAKEASKVYNEGLIMLRRKFTAASLLFFAILAAGCAIPTPVTRPPQGLEKVGRLLEGYQERGAFPGGVLAAGRDLGDNGSLVHLHSFGRLTYDADAPKVTAGTLYDLA